MLIPLRTFIHKYLKNLKIKNIFTNKIENAEKIFSWDSSGALDILMSNDYYIETKYNFATDEKEFGLVKIDKKEVITDTWQEKVLVPITKTKYRLVESNDIKGYKTEFKPIFKWIKIGRSKVFTTTYKKVKVPIYKKEREYYTVIDYEYQTITKTKTKKVSVYKKIMFRDYTPYLLYEKYKYDSSKGDIIHSLFIAPFYSRYGQAFVVAKKDSIGNYVYTTPEDMSLSKEYKDFISDCKQVLFQNTTPKESISMLKEHIRNLKRKNHYKASYSYSEDIIDTVFFTDTKTNNNKEVIELTKEQLKEELNK